MGRQWKMVRRTKHTHAYVASNLQHVMGNILSVSHTTSRHSLSMCINILTTPRGQYGFLNFSHLSHGLWTSKKGSFQINAAYLVEFCPKACNVCDIHLDERDMSLGLGLPQEAAGMEDDRHLFHHIRAKVQEVRHYVENLENRLLREACKMAHPNCARFSLATDCEDFADHEIIKYGCAAACMTCEQLELEENGIAKAEAYWSSALKEYEEKQQRSYTMTV
jgi:hypothetical protein